jgi:hypothetical protein
MSFTSTLRAPGMFWRDLVRSVKHLFDEVRGRRFLRRKYSAAYHIKQLICAGRRI